MVEHLQRQKKAALKCYPNCSLWIDGVPLILLGIRTALKGDLHCTLTPSDYPDNFGFTAHFRITAGSNFLSWAFKNTIVTSHLASGSHLTFFVHPELHTCTHVFIWYDAMKSSLQPTHNGPYKVLECKEWYFVVELSSTSKDTCLKPAYLHQKTKMIFVFTQHMFNCHPPNLYNKHSVTR